MDIYVHLNLELVPTFDHLGTVMKRKGVSIMEKIIIEVGSTCTKFDLYDGNTVKHLETAVIELKRNFKKL